LIQLHKIIRFKEKYRNKLYKDWCVIEHNVEKNCWTLKTHRWYNSIYYAQCKQWKFMHFENFSYFSKHSNQIKIGEKIMHFGLIS
jgi:hypothetical protein